MDEVTFIPFYPEHLARIALSEKAAIYRDFLADPARLAFMVAPGLSWTGMWNGTVIGCAGICRMWPGRAAAWAIIGQVPMRAWPAITKKVVEVLGVAHASGLARIETTVQADFPAGRRWADRLGFVCETPVPMRAYAPNGSDHYLYARVRP